MRQLIVLVALLCAAPALADDNALARRVMTCFKVSPQDFSSGAEATISVTVAANGLPSAIDVLSYKPDTADGRRIAMEAAKAIQACGPYPAGTPSQTITMGPSVTYSDAEGSIITMPDRADGLDDSLANDIGKIIGQ